MLTEKAKEDFYNYLCDTKPIIYIYVDKWFKVLHEEFQYALIVQWFDSIGINFNRGLSFSKSKKYKCEVYINENDNLLGHCLKFKGKFLGITELEVVRKAINRADNIYNNKYANSRKSAE